MTKTNAIRLLESKKVEFSTIEYEFSEDELDAISVAKKIGKPPEEVFKTLVAQATDGEILIYLIPGNCELNLKKAASSASKKNIELIPVKLLEHFTGYIRGGCSPIGMKKDYRTFIDETATLYETISISSGKRGMQIIINPICLSEFISANFYDLI